MAKKIAINKIKAPKIKAARKKTGAALLAGHTAVRAAEIAAENNTDTSTAAPNDCDPTVLGSAANIDAREKVLDKREKALEERIARLKLPLEVSKMFEESTTNEARRPLTADDLVDFAHNSKQHLVLVERLVPGPGGFPVVQRDLLGMAPKVTKPTPRGIHYAHHSPGNNGSRYRVWLNSWIDDQFEIVEASEFDRVKEYLTRMNLGTVLHFHEDDDEHDD